MHILSESFKNVKTWLLNSNLVIRDKNDDNCGGLHSFFDEDKKQTINIEKFDNNFLGIVGSNCLATIAKLNT